MTKNAWDAPLPTANGQIFIGQDAGPPAWATLTAGTGTSISNTAGGATINFDSALQDFDLIATVTASASSAVTFTGLSADYDTYWITFQGIQPTDDDQIMYLRTSSDNGISYDSGASDYAWSSSGVSDGGTFDQEGSAADTQISLAGDQASEELGNGTNETLSGNLTIYNPSGTQWTKFNFNFTYLDLSGDSCSLTGGGARLATADVDALRIFMATSTINGLFKLYGYKA